MAFDDRGFLDVNFGFASHPAPILSNRVALTHQNLPLTFDLTTLAGSSASLALTYRLVSATHGTARISPDGASLIFTPEPGFSGAASFQIQAADSSTISAAATVTVNVSGAALLGLDYESHQPRLEIGDVWQVVVLGDFADQADVVLPASYLTFTATAPAVCGVSKSGWLWALSHGTGVLLASQQQLQAATAFMVGQPATAQEQALADLGLLAYPRAITLPQTDGWQPLHVYLPDLTEASLGSLGTEYYSGNSAVVTVDADGLLKPVSAGTTTVTVIHQMAEMVIPVTVSAAQAQPTLIGAPGGVVQAANGLSLAVPPGAVLSDTTFTLSPLTETALSLPIAAPFQFVAGFRLETGGVSLLQRPQLMLTLIGDLPIGGQLIVHKAGTVPSASGVEQDAWFQVEVLTIQSGLARTTGTPGALGVLDPGQYAIVYAPADSVTQVNGQLSLANPLSPLSMGIVAGVPLTAATRPQSLAGGNSGASAQATKTVMYLAPVTPSLFGVLASPTEAAFFSLTVPSGIYDLQTTELQYQKLPTVTSSRVQLNANSTFEFQTLFPNKGLAAGDPSERPVPSSVSVGFENVGGSVTAVLKISGSVLWAQAPWWPQVRIQDRRHHGRVY